MTISSQKALSSADGEQKVASGEAAATDADRKKTEILRQAAEIFCAQGFHATSMSEVAEAVGLTKAGLYYYVKGKEDLLFSIVTFGMDRLESWIEDAREAPEPVDRLRRVLRSHAAAITQDGSAVTLLVDEVEALSPEHRRLIEARQRRYFEFVRDTLVEIGGADERSGIDPTVAAFGVLGSVLWLARWYRPDGRLSAAQVAEELTEFALKGLP